MKRKGWFIVVTVALAMSFILGLAGCGGGGNPPQEPEHKHTYASQYSYDEEYHWYSATCEHPQEVSGKGTHNFGTDDVCDVCSYAREHVHTFSDQLSSNAQYHYYLATCGHTGEYKDVEAHVGDPCSVCGYDSSTHEHTFSDQLSSNAQYHYYLATCGHTGVYKDAEKHTGNPCTVCGYQANVYTAVNYSLLSETTCEITSLYDKTAVDIVIPAKLNNGYIVKGISYDAFKNNTNIKSVTIQEGVEYIHGGAFSGCTSLASIDLPESMKEVSSLAFKNTAYYNDEDNWTNGVLYIDNCLVDVDDEFDTGVLNIKEGTTVIGGYACSGASFTEIHFPSTMKYVGEFALQINSKLTTLDMNEGLKSIGDLFIQDCNNLKTISIPSTLEECSGRSFYGGGIATLTMKGESDAYRVENNCLIDKRTNTLVYVPSATTGSFLVPSVTHIGNYAFGDSNLQSVTLPSGLKTIGNSAFTYANLTQIDLPDSVESVEGLAFSYCSNLQSIYLGAGLTSLDSSAFSNCTNLKTVNVSADNQTITKTNGIVVDWNEKITLWADPTITSANIPNGVEKISANLFKEHQNITSVNVPDSVTTIYARAFYQCPNLQTVSIGSGFQETPFQSSIFRGCTKLKTVTLKSGIKVIGEYMFYGCTALEEIVIPDTVISIGRESFKECTSLTSAVIGKNVEEIAYEAFYKCEKLASLQLKGGTVLGMRAFAECLSLKTVVLPESVYEIGDGAFKNCSGLTEITFTKSVVEIGMSAFYNCNSLNKVSYNGTDAEWAAIKTGDNNTPLLNAKKKS